MNEVNEAYLFLWDINVWLEDKDQVIYRNHLEEYKAEKASGTEEQIERSVIFF